MELARWARSVGVHPQTAYAWVREDRMPVPFRRLPSGTILVDVATSSALQRVVLYARVSSHDQRADLARQVFRLTGWATGSGFEVGQVVAEVGSGLNGKRPKLARVLSDPRASVIVMEHRDRLARFGVEHLHAALAAQGRRIVVVDDGETTDDLVREMIEVLTSMRARLYGRRGARNRALRALTATKHIEPAATGG
ncbi:MAG TPA: IS607 family transposase [Mycobacterium sp.]